MMTDKKDLRKNLNICLLLTLLLCVLAVVPLFAPQADAAVCAAGGLAFERSIICRAGCACAAAAVLR